MGELLDLQAGAGSAELEPTEQSPGCLSDAATVDASSVLSGKLRDEKGAYLRSIGNSRGYAACACML